VSVTDEERTDSAGEKVNFDLLEHLESVADRPARVRRGLHAWLTAGAKSKVAPPARRNPFLPPEPAPAADDDESDVAGWTPVVQVGPAAPTGAPAPAEPALTVPEKFPTAEPDRSVAVQVAGLHGGAGTSTVAALLGDAAVDCGVGLGLLTDPSVPVLLVTRTHAHGLDLLRRAAGQFGAGDLEQLRILGVVLVDDAPTTPKVLQRTIRSLRRSLPYSWRIGWSEDLRQRPTPPEPAHSGVLRRVRKSVLSKADEMTTSAASDTQSATDSQSTTDVQKGIHQS
jgi:hypothetical protein